MSVNLAQTNQIIVCGKFYRRVEILAYVDAEYAAKLRAFDVFYQRVHAEIVESHAIDDGLCLRQTKQARLGVAWLWARGDSADLDKAKTERGQRINICAVLVQPGG